MAGHDPEMRALRIVSHDGPKAAKVERIVIPDRATGEVLVEVHAAGIAFPDVLQSWGRYQNKVPLPATLGSELAGVVVSADPGSEFKAGDRVLGVVQAGAFAEFVSVPEDRLLPLPESVPFEIAAGVPINVLSADFALVDRARVLLGETVLVHGAAGGFGLALVQQARHHGARVIAVTSTPEKAEAALRAGAHEAVSASSFLEETRVLTGGVGVDIVLDTVGGDRFTDSIRALSPRGRVVVLGFVAGDIPTVKVNRLLLRNVSVIGSAWEGLMPTSIVSLPEQWKRLQPQIEQGSFWPSITGAVALEEVPGVLAAMENREIYGKFVVRVRAAAA